MSDRKTTQDRGSPRVQAKRHDVLAAAETLLRNGRAEFSMRDLAAEAGVSFATPFNQFGSKVAIMQALSAQRIAAMGEIYAKTNPGGDAADRVLAAVDIAARVMLAEPEVNKALMASLGAPVADPGDVYGQSRALWALALGDADGFSAETIGLARSLLPDQLAVAFRGVLSFWTAGEIADGDLAPRARTAAAVLLLGFLAPDRRAMILAGPDLTA